MSLIHQSHPSKRILFFHKKVQKSHKKVIQNRSRSRQLSVLSDHVFILYFICWSGYMKKPLHQFNHSPNSGGFWGVGNALILLITVLLDQEMNFEKKSHRKNIFYGRKIFSKKSWDFFRFSNFRKNQKYRVRKALPSNFATTENKNHQWL